MRWIVPADADSLPWPSDASCHGPFSLGMEVMSLIRSMVSDPSSSAASCSHPGDPLTPPLTFHLGVVRVDVSAGGGRPGRPSGDPDWRDVTWVVVSSIGEHGGLLLERDRELQRIGECLQRAQQGRGGALVVEGPAGIGKTVLLAVARDAAGREGFRVLRARGAELEREFAFGVVRQLVEPVVAGASEEERSQLLDGPPGVAARLLGLPGGGDGVAAAAPIAPDPSFAVLHGLYWLCANLAAQRPLALVVDDAHWADGASLRFLAFLLPRLEELHVAVLLGARPAEVGESRELLAVLTMDPATEVVTVGPLTPAGVATLLAVALGIEPEPEFAAACWEATGGTPFLVRTLVEALREEQIAPVASSAAKVQNVATDTLSRWAMLRLVRLGPEAARLARAVAVLERAELDQAARLAGLAPPDARAGRRPAGPSGRARRGSAVFRPSASAYRRLP